MRGKEEMEPWQEEIMKEHEEGFYDRHLAFDVELSTIRFIEQVLRDEYYSTERKKVGRSRKFGCFKERC